MDYQRLFVDNLALLDRIVRFVAGRYHLTPEEAEELAAEARFKLINNDYEVLRAFGGRCALKTFLTTVVANLNRDLRDAKWGKWRPCADAKRLGPVAVLLDQLLSRDGYAGEEAIAILRTNHRVTESADQLRDICERLPLRTRRRFVGEDQLERVQDPASTEDALMSHIDGHATRQRVSAALEAALGRLDETARVIMRMYGQGARLSTIARSLAIDTVYPKVERIKATLRKDLEEQGVSVEDIRFVLGTDDVSVSDDQ